MLYVNFYQRTCSIVQTVIANRIVNRRIFIFAGDGSFSFLRTYRENEHHLLLLSHYRETRRRYLTYIRSLLVSVLQYPLHFTFASRQPFCCMTFHAYNGRKLIHMYSPMRESLKENRKRLLSVRENPGTAGVSNGNCGENNSCLNISEIK